MKLKTTQYQCSTPLLISEKDKSPAYFYEGIGWLFAPTPPTMEAVKRAQFKDKTYVWQGR